MTEPGNEEQHDDSQTAAEDAEEKRINDPLTRTEVMGPRVPFGSPARGAVDQLRVRERRKREASRWVLLSGGACQGVLSFAKPRQAVCGQCYLVDHGDVGGVFYGDLSMCVLVCASYCFLGIGSFVCHKEGGIGDASVDAKSAQRPGGVTLAWQCDDYC